MHLCALYILTDKLRMKAQDMYIHLNGLKLYAYHGVLPQENRIGAEYTLNLRLKTDFSHAAENDCLEGTVNYAEVFKAVKEEMNIPSLLLEHVIRRIASRLLNDFPAVSEVRITLDKQNPPMGADCKEVGVEATFCRLSCYLFSGFQRISYICSTIINP